MMIVTQKCCARALYRDPFYPTSGTYWPPS